MTRRSILGASSMRATPGLPQLKSGLLKVYLIRLINGATDVSRSFKQVRDVASQFD